MLHDIAIFLVDSDHLFSNETVTGISSTTYPIILSYSRCVPFCHSQKESYMESNEFPSGWWFGTFFIFPFSWECHHPNWLIFFRGVGLPPPTRYIAWQQQLGQSDNLRQRLQQHRQRFGERLEAVLLMPVALRLQIRWCFHREFMGSSRSSWHLLGIRRDIMIQWWEFWNTHI